MTDPRIVRLVVMLVGIVEILLVGIIGVLAASHVAIPDGVITLAGTGLGTLGALLVSTHSGPLQSVTVPLPTVTVAPVETVAP